MRVHPPARHGDLFDPAITEGDTVVVIDGAYHQAPALRHKEILAALARGIRVYGAASIGALRAVELAPYGMTGIGRVYHSYASGEVVGDDEVAVGQRPDGAYERLTWPLVNLREVLRQAVSDRILDTQRAGELLGEWGAVYYPQRTLDAVRSACRRLGAHAFERWLMARLAADEHFGDVKRADAIEAVTVACAAARPQPCAASAGCWDTVYFRRWACLFTPSSTGEGMLPIGLRLSYQRLFDPDFPTAWRAWLKHLSRHPHPESVDEAMPLASRVHQVAPGAATVLPHLVFRPEPDLSDPTTGALLLMRETSSDRTAIKRYLDANHDARTNDGLCLEAISAAAARHTLQRLWKTGPDAVAGHAATCGYRTPPTGSGRTEGVHDRAPAGPEPAPRGGGPVTATVLRLEGTVRARNPQDTWDSLQPLLADFGITRGARLTGLDCLGWPVWTAIRPAAQTLTATQGKGATDLLAKISAVMESIELWHAERPPRIALKAAAADLDLPYPLRALLLHQHHPDLAAVMVDWVTCTGVLTGKLTLLPAGLIHRSAARRLWEPDLWHTTSTGLACGNTHTEAILHALLEVIERDVLADGDARHAASRRLIHPATVEDRYRRQLLDSLYQAGMEVEISAVENAYGLPVCLALVWSEDFPLWLAGSGCHLTAPIALSRALTEAMQSRLTCIAGTRDDLPSQEEVFTAAPQPGPVPAPGPRLEWSTVMSEVLGTPGGDFAQQVAAAAGQVEKATGYEPLVVDLADAASPIAAVKVICPGTRSRTTRAVAR